MVDTDTGNRSGSWSVTVPVDLRERFEQLRPLESMTYGETVVFLADRYEESADYEKRSYPGRE